MSSPKSVTGQVLATVRALDTTSTSASPSECITLITEADNWVLKKNFMAPFYGWGSTASRLVPLRGGSLLFTTKFLEILGTRFIDLGRMNG